jgi:hypothetical protein
MNLTKEQETQFKEKAIEYLHEIGIEVENIKYIEIISVESHPLDYITRVKFRYKNYIITNNGDYWSYRLMSKVENLKKGESYDKCNKKSKKMLNLFIVFFILFILGCGSSGNNSEINDNDNFVFIKLTMNSIKNPLKASYNIYEIDFVGDSYLKIKLNKSSRFLYSNGGIEYFGSSAILDLNGSVTGYKSGDILPAGEYILKIHSDTNLEKYHPFITFIANNLDYTKIYSLLLENGEKYNVPPGFKGYFKIYIENKKCLGVEGGYQDVKLYDLNLSETGYDLDNHVECDIPEGEYILYYNNHTVYENSFKIYYE